MDFLKSAIVKVTEMAGDDVVKKTIISQIKGSADSIAAAVQTLFGGKFSIPKEVIEQIKNLDDNALDRLIDKAPSITNLEELKSFFI